MSAFPFALQKSTGVWELHEAMGKYTFHPATGQLELDTGTFARFFCEPVSAAPLKFPAGRGKVAPKVKSSEIMKEIQNEASDGALFVLPSQLNGAEYTSHTKSAIVEHVEEYMRDNTGGPRGQLAAHPGAAQFVIDNAANDLRRDGINAVDQLLQLDPIKDFLELKNGYLIVKDPKSEDVEKEVLDMIDAHLHTLRPLIMEDIPATGLTPDKRRRAETCTHKVGLVYASAVPVLSYMNKGPGAARREFQVSVAERILVAQYFGALQHAARSVDEKRPRRTVYLMPLGGGVFNNPWESIANSMCTAMQMLDEESLAKLDVFALAWEGSRTEQETLERLLK